MYSLSHYHQPMTWHRWQWSWLVVAATLWAALVRLYHLGSLPPQAWVDEAWFNLRARDLLLTGDFHVYYRTFWGGMHPLLVNLAAVAHGLGLHSLVASRIVVALGGIVTIPLVYVTTNELWRTAQWSLGRRRFTAALTAVIVSNLLYLVLASRIGYEPALIPPVMLFYIWQVRRGQATGRWLSLVAAGVALGAAQYLNPNGRFLIPLALALGLYDLLISPPARRRSVFLGLFVVATTAVALALPLILFFIREPQWLLARAGHVTTGLQGGSAAWLVNNALNIVASLNFVGDFNPRHNLPGRPMFDWLQSLGLGVGLWWALRNFRRQSAGRELLGWLGLMTVSSLITDDAPQFERMIGVGIPAAALVAVGWVEMWAWLQRTFRARAALRPGGLASVATLMIVVSTGLGTYDFFVRYPRTPGLSAAMTSFPVDLANDLIARAETEAVFVERIPEAEDVYAFDFLFPGTNVRRLDFRQCLPLTAGRATPTTYLVFDERDPGSKARLRQAFPQLTVFRLTPDPATLMDSADLIEIPAGAPAPPMRNPAHARFAPGLTLLGYDLSETHVQAGQSTGLTLYWQVDTAPGPATLTAFAHLGATSGVTELITQSDHLPCQGLYPPALWQPGDVIPDAFAITIPPDTPPGDYPIAIGWYEHPSLQRLTLQSADHPLPDNRVLLTTLTVISP